MHWHTLHNAQLLKGFPTRNYIYRKIQGPLHADVSYISVDTCVHCPVAEFIDP
jgi:hypothetical protein